MAKTSIDKINLLVEKAKDPEIVIKLKKVLPIVAAILTPIFLIFYFVTLIYLNLNVRKYQSEQNEIKRFEDKLKSAQTKEGQYIFTKQLLTQIASIQKIKKDYYKFFKTINNLGNPQISISNVTVSDKNEVDVSISAYDVYVLEEFINEIIKLDESENQYFSNFKASNISRDKSGKYIFILKMQVNQEIFQQNEIK
jgi:hypothetical protein